MRTEGSSHLKISKDSPGIEPGTPRLVAQCFIQLWKGASNKPWTIFHVYQNVYSSRQLLFSKSRVSDVRLLSVFSSLCTEQVTREWSYWLSCGSRETCLKYREFSPCHCCMRPHTLPWYSITCLLRDIMGNCLRTVWRSVAVAFMSDALYFILWQGQTCQSSSAVAQCFSNWVPWNPRVLQNTVSGSERNNVINT